MSVRMADGTVAEQPAPEEEAGGEIRKDAPQENQHSAFVQPTQGTV